VLQQHEINFHSLFAGQKHSIHSGPTKDMRIGIVGAGPGGITMAYELYQAGYNNVEVLEAKNRLGGKSVEVSINDIEYPMSTYLLTPDYEDTITAFMKENDLYNVRRWNRFYLLEDGEK